MLHTIREIAFIASDIPEGQTLIAGIKKGIETAILDPNCDAIAQIGETLKGKKYSAIHIICHGAPGHLQLGNTALNIETLPQYTFEIQQWRESLTAEASILLYGCNVAQSVGAGPPTYLRIIDNSNKPAPTPPCGNQFLTQLHQLTGAFIAANPNPTGNSARGGTWKLTSSIPPSPQAPKLALTETALKTYSGILGLAPKVDFPTGNDPNWIGIRDFNGDGKQDVATGNSGSNTTSILINTTPTGATIPTFAPKVDFTTGDQPNSLSIDDFNRDGKQDVATANFSSDTTSILINTTATGATTPTFATQVTFPTGTGPISVSIGDFNRDGSPDVATANQFSNTTSILINTTATGATTPTFAPKVDFPTGNGPNWVSIDDFNGDGKADVAVTKSDNYTSILLNTTTTTGATTPTFATQVTFPTGIGPYSLSTGDINGDGSPDVATANFTSNTTSILLNTTTTGATTPTFASKVDFPSGTPNSVSIGDLNGDGKADVATANRNSSDTTSILINTAPTGATTPDFAPFVSFPTGSQPFWVSIGDINGDGKPDVATANRASSTISILLNNTPKVSIAAGITPTETGPTNGTFTITLDTPAPAGGLVVNFDTTGSTATNPTHYSLSAGTNITAVTANTFTIAADATTAVLNAVPVDDAIINPGETIKVNVTADTNNWNYFLDPVVANTTATLTITDNDDFPTVNLSVSPATTTETGSPAITVTATASSAVVGDQTVEVNLSGTATDDDFTGFIPASITIADGETTGSFTVNINDDGIVEGSETGTFTISNPSSGIVLGTTTTGEVEITDDDFPTVNLSVSPATITETGSPTLTVTATASSAVVGDQTVEVNLSGTATDDDFTGFIPASITIADGETTGSFTVNINDDGIVEGSETGTFTISNPSSGIVLGTTTTGEVEITDDDFPKVNLSVSPATTTETGSPTITVTATASQAVVGDQTVEVNLSGTATDDDFTGFIPASITIADGETTGSFTVNINDDGLVEGSETGTFTISNPSSGIVLGTTTTGEVTITEDDCICDDIDYPNLNQPNRVENTILGVSTIQIGTAQNDEFLGSNSGNIFDAKSGDDNLYGGDIHDILNGNQGNDFISGGNGDDILLGDENNDIILGNLGQDLIWGGKGKDSLNGGEGKDLILGDEDNDFIDGDMDNDTLFGGKGEDIMLGSLGDDYLSGNQGSDTICGGEGKDFIRGNEQADILGGCEGNDTLYGGEDNDTLTGCQGDDILYGELGNDSLTGGSGNDIFVLNSGQGFDVIADFTVGQDLIRLSSGLSFDQLAITQNTQGTIIKNILTGEQLGVMIGVSANAITSANFLLI
jgi:Ca2+-binding RTX toxin-like protein